MWGSMKPRLRNRRDGFTLLELLVVVAILVIVAGGLIVAFDGLEVKSAEGVSAYNIAGLDNSIRSFRATNGGLFPNDFDSLLFSTDATATAAQPLNALPPTLLAKIGPHTLSAAGALALNNAGITTARYVIASATGPTGATTTYDNAPTPINGGTGTQPEIPNRVFDDPEAEGHGVSVPLAAGVVVAAVETGNGSVVIDSFAADGDATVSSRLNEYFGLPSTQAHLAVVFGVGNRSTLVQSATGRFDVRAASLAQAPFYQKVKPTEYGRFLAVFLLATDADGNGTFDAGDYFENARLLGVIDTLGDHFDEEAAEFQGVKP